MKREGSYENVPAWVPAIVIGFLVVVVSLVISGCIMGPVTTTPTPTPVAYTEPVLVQGVALDSADIFSLAAEDECLTQPLVFDVRSNDDPSLNTLPRLEEGEYQRLKAFYNFQERYEYGCSKAQPGQLYWDLYGVEFKCGPAVVQPQMRNEDGTPAAGILAFLHWPDAEQFPITVDPPYSQFGVAAWTDGGGSVGWGYGGESHIGPDGGPYMTWVSSDPTTWEDRRVGSDALDKIGWWDNHCTPNGVYKSTRKEGAQPTGEHRLVDVDEHGNEVGYIPFQVGTPPVDIRLLILRSPAGLDLGYVPWMGE